jgi:hypothetical protein
VCVGNSLALVADFEAVERAVRAMLAALRPGGVCVLQVLNLWHLRDGPCVWQKCLRTTLDRQEHILLKGVHRCGTQGFVELIDLAVTAHGAEPRADSVKFLGLEQEHVAQMLTQAGGSARFYGSFQQAPYRRAESQDLIVVAEK